MEENKSLIALAIKLESLLVESTELQELPEEINQLINTTETELAQKVDAYYYVIERMKAAQEYYKKQADEFTRIRKQCETLEDRLKSRLKETMLLTGQNELIGQNRRFCLSDSRPRLVITDESKIPNKYKVVRYEVDKNSLSVDLSLNQKIEGAHLEASHSLRSYAVNPSSRSNK